MKLNIRTLVSHPLFWIVILIGLVAQVMPYLFTQHAPTADSNTVAGFPFTFLSYGGLCGFMNGLTGQCPRTFIPLHVFFDSVVFVTLGVLTVHFFQRRNRV